MYRTLTNSIWLKRKDRYNKKLMKYKVTYEEGDEELSEDEERHVRADEDVPKQPMVFKCPNVWLRSIKSIILDQI